MFGFIPLVGKLPAVGKALTAAVASFLVWQVYLAVVPSRPEYSERQLRMVAELSQQAVSWLGTINVDRGLVVFGNLQGDSFGVVSLPLRNALWRTDSLELAERGFIEKLRERLLWTLPTFSPEDGLPKLAQSRQAQYAVGGELVSFEDNGSQGRLTARLVLWDAAQSANLAEKEFLILDPSPKTTALAPAAETPGMPVTYRLFGWLVLTGVLPLSLLARRRVLIEAGNEFLLAVLVCLILVSLLLSYLFVAKSVPPLWGGLIMLLTLPLSALYHANALAFLRERLQ